MVVFYYLVGSLILVCYEMPLFLVELLHDEHLKFHPLWLQHLKEYPVEMDGGASFYEHLMFP